MSKKNNRTCVCCGKEYHFCNTCASQINEPRWRNIYCSDNCRKVFMTITDYNYKEITEEQAIQNLKESDLNSNFNESITNAINKLMNSVKKVPEEKTTEELVESEQNIDKKTGNRNKVKYQKTKTRTE